MNIGSEFFSSPVALSEAVVHDSAIRRPNHSLLFPLPLPLPPPIQNNGEFLLPVSTQLPPSTLNCVGLFHWSRLQSLLLPIPIAPGMIKEPNEVKHDWMHSSFSFALGNQFDKELSAAMRCVLRGWTRDSTTFLKMEKRAASAGNRTRAARGLHDS